jgi:hypothetical protein
MTNDDFNDGPHENLIKAFMEYFKHNDNFMRKGAFEPSVKARNALSDIRRYATERRDEIFDTREAKRQQVRQKKAQKRQSENDKDNT